MRIRPPIPVLLPVLLLLAPLAAQKVKKAEPAPPEPVRVVCVGTTTGPEAAIALGLRVGFRDVARRAAGQEWLRPFELHVLDDGGVAKDAAKRFETLAAKTRLDLVVGGGSSTRSEVFRKEMRKAGVVHCGPSFSLRASEALDGLSVRAPLDRIVARLVDRLVEDGCTRFALLVPKNRSSLRALVDTTLRARDSLRLVGVVRHVPGERDLKLQADALAKVKPDAVLLLGEPQANVQFVRRMRSGYEKLEIRYATTASVEASELVRVLGDDADGIYVGSGLPWPWGDWLPLTKDWQAACKRQKVAAPIVRSFRAFEGYVTARLLERLVGEAIGGHAVARRLVEAARSSGKGWDLDGVQLRWTEPLRHWGQARSYLSRVVGGRLEPVPETDDPAGRPAKD